MAARQKILVADDKASSRELIRTVLEHAGYEVIEAVDGIEALDMARLYNPSLILLDLQMPRLDGFAAVQEMRRDPKRWPLALERVEQLGDADQHCASAGFMVR